MTETERAEWLRERRTGIGSSDTAALMLPCGTPGVYSTPLKIYMDKLGLLPPEDSPQMRWGRELESIVANAFKYETGKQGVFVPKEALHRSESHPWMLASPDRLIPCESALLECKCADAYQRDKWGPSGGDIVPDGYLIQVQHQLAVLGLERAYLAVLIGGNDFRWYCLPRHEWLIDEIVRFTRNFWGMVARREQPQEDWSHPDTPRLLEILRRPVDGTPPVELDGRAVLIVDHLQDIGEQIGELKKLQERERDALYRLMDGASVATLPDGRRAERKRVTVKEHVVKESSYLRLYIKGHPNVN